MTLVDFVFRGDRLSDIDGMIAYMVTSPSESVSMGSTMTHETLYINSTYKTKKLKAKYEEPITATWDIFKSDCHGANLAFTDKEISHFMKWLGAKTSQKFIPIYDDDSYPGIYYMGTFNQIDGIVMNDQIVGFTVTFEADAAWGYGHPRTIKHSGTTNNWTFNVNCDSDDEGFLYPIETIVKMNGSGEFVLQHAKQATSETTLDGFEVDPVVIKSCSNNEIIKFNSELKIITELKLDENGKLKELTIEETNIKHPKLYNDFNYNYPKLFTEYRNTKNIFSVSIPCEITMTYSPIRKVGILV